MKRLPFQWRSDAFLHREATFLVFCTVTGRFSLIAVPLLCGNKAIGHTGPVSIGHTGPRRPLSRCGRPILMLLHAPFEPSYRTDADKGPAPDKGKLEYVSDVPLRIRSNLRQLPLCIRGR